MPKLLRSLGPTRWGRLRLQHSDSGRACVADQAEKREDFDRKFERGLLSGMAMLGVELSSGCVVTGRVTTEKFVRCGAPITIVGAPLHRLPRTPSFCQRPSISGVCKNTVEPSGGQALRTISQPACDTSETAPNTIIPTCHVSWIHLCVALFHEMCELRIESGAVVLTGEAASVPRTSVDKCCGSAVRLFGDQVAVIRRPARGGPFFIGNASLQEIISNLSVCGPVTPCAFQYKQRPCRRTACVRRTDDHHSHTTRDVQ